jgi:transcriptional regulator with XRE-family HTH domain
VEREAEIVANVVRQLRELREAKGISIYRLSKETGLSSSGLRHMENGDVTPTLYFLLRVCSYFDVDLAKLLKEARTS